MVEQTRVRVIEVGSVTATVYRINGFTPEFRVKLSTSENTDATYSPAGLLMVQEAAQQAEWFIRGEQEVARRNPCPGCGDG